MNGGDYRYGFNGKENDNEVKGDGNSVDFGARMYDSRLGRWFAIDPLASKYPSMSPYNFVGNSPLIAIDPDGKRIIVLNKEAAEAIKLTLSPEEAKYVEFNEYGELNHQKLLEGYSAIGVKNIGSNFESLLEVSKNIDIVEVSVAQSYEICAGERMFPSKVVNDYIDEWMFSYIGNEDLTGEIEIGGQKYNFDEFKQYYDENEIGSGIYVPGAQGITQIPTEFILTEFDKKITEEALKLGGKVHDNLINRRVVINKKTFEVNRKGAAAVTAHELYGHAKFSVMKKSAFHGPRRNIDNQELEKEISKSVKEAEDNYDKHNP